MKSPTRRRHHKAEKLSLEAVRLIEDGLAANVSYDVIAQRVREKTDDKISTAAIGRYYRAKFSPRREAQRSTAELVRQVFEAAGDVTPENVRAALEAKAAQQLFPVMEALAAEKPEHAAYFYASIVQRRIDEQKLAQKQAELELRADALKLAKEAQDAKLAEIRRRAEAASAPDAKKKTKEELLQTIRELYGLARETPSPSQGAR